MPKLKKLGLIATAFIVLAWLLVFVVSPVYAAITWQSFSDPGYPSPDENFTGDEDTVYMAGSGFATNTQYKVAYYEADTDGAGTDDYADWLVTDTPTSNWFGFLESELHFPNYNLPTTDAGEWHSVVYNWADSPPSTYNATGSIADDTFTVAVEVIPEFPKVIAMIVAMGLSFGIYYWMRQRYHRKAVTAEP